MTRARRWKMVGVVVAASVLLGIAAVWTYGTGERTYYGAHTGVLHVGDIVAIAQDVHTPDSRIVHRGIRGVVQADPAWDEDSCYPDRPIAVELDSGERVSVPRNVLHR